MNRNEDPLTYDKSNTSAHSAYALTIALCKKVPKEEKRTRALGKVTIWLNVDTLEVGILRVIFLLPQVRVFPLRQLSSPFPNPVSFSFSSNISEVFIALRYPSILLCNYSDTIVNIVPENFGESRDQPFNSPRPSRTMISIKLNCFKQFEAYS